MMLMFVMVRAVQLWDLTSMVFGPGASFGASDGRPWSARGILPALSAIDISFSFTLPFRIKIYVVTRAGYGHMPYKALEWR